VQFIVIGPVCGRAGGRAVFEPYYSQRPRSVGVSLSAFLRLLSDLPTDLLDVMQYDIVHSCTHSAFDSW